MEPTAPRGAGRRRRRRSAPLATAALALARRFAAARTLWCIAPEWPEHARHVAVEFVHPVIVGKRALPAVSVDGADPVGVAAGPVPAPATSCLVDRARRRSPAASSRPCAGPPAWGAHDGLDRRRRPSGPPAERGRPRRSGLDDARRVTSAPSTTAASCCCYHVLWELTHVCFEHPGLLDRRRPRRCDDDGRASPAPTRAAWPRWSPRSTHGAAACARPRHRDGRHHPRRRRRARRPRARPRRRRHRRLERWPHERGAPTSSTRSSRATSATREHCCVDLARSADAKAQASAAAPAATPRAMRAVARAAPPRRCALASPHGGRLFTFGNGGSSTDAASLAALFARPPWGRPLPARCLVDDRPSSPPSATTSGSTSCSRAS